jgi:hypothetical protein
MAFLNSGLSAIGNGFALIVIVLAQQQHVPATFIGVIFAVGGATRIFGAFFAPMLQRRLSYGWTIIGLWWLYVLAWVLLVVAFAPFVLGAFVGVFLLIDGVYNIVQFSYRLALIPDELQGRVNSAFRLISYSLRPLGIVVIGVLVQFIGAFSTAVVCLIGLVLLALAASLNSSVRKAGMLAAIRDV